MALREPELATRAGPPSIVRRNTNSRRDGREPHFLLIGPYDPLCGEYTFLAPPLGVWRLAGHLRARDVVTTVFDPNCCTRPVMDELTDLLRAEPWDVVGVSTTGMTLRYDLQLAHHVKRVAPQALLVAGGMEATFNPERLLALCPFDLLVLGEGEKPLAALAARLRAGADLCNIPGTVTRTATGERVTLRQLALTREELRDAIVSTPYELMPYSAYWERLESAYQVGALPFKADREARLAEIRSVRLSTLNYCPMACSFCSSTNFLHEAQGGVARVARLEADECLAMIQRILAAHPQTRTVIFQDDIFVFTQDRRILPLCAGIVSAKQRGDLPPDLQFISTNRIDSMTPERLRALRRAGFRVLGFGVENFSSRVLTELNKGQIHKHIDPTLAAALEEGITPFLDLILTSPRSNLEDLAHTLREAYRWIRAGCEIGIYPYVIPFSGAALAKDPELQGQTVYETVSVPGTAISWRQATKMLPFDPVTRQAILTAETRFNRALAVLHSKVSHLPSRARSLLWIASTAPVLCAAGQPMPAQASILAALASRLPPSAPALTPLLGAVLEYSADIRSDSELQGAAMIEMFAQ
jgi:radical SAM superfamily enzyme YgiQ (UPF0313 family)